MTVRRTTPGGIARTMPHVALYRKYRSQSFEDLVGQEHITKTIQSAISSGRIAHAYLFVGPRGTGKTSTARILAKALNCENGPTPTPCGECRLCKAITAGQGGDVIELDAASESGVEEVRQLIEAAQYTPMEGRYKIYIIDEVHDLSPKAFDAFLKTVEEPPAHVVFIMATTEFNKVPVTIRSRCQRYEFHRGSMRELTARLEYICNCEQVKFEPAALASLARMADGGYRDALSLLEQVLLIADGGLTQEAVVRQLGLIGQEQTDAILEAAHSGDVKALLQAANAAARQGKEPRAVLESLLLRISELTHSLYETADELDPERQAANHALASRIGASELLRYRAIIAEAHKEIRDVTLPSLWLELALQRLVQTAPAPARTEQPPKQAQQPQPPKSNGAMPKAASVELDRAWRETRKLLEVKSPATGKLLERTSPIRVEADTVVIGFTHKMQLDRVISNLKGQEFIQKFFHQATGSADTKLKYELAAPDVGPETAAVELPAEGEALAKMVTEVFDVKSEQ